VWIGVDWSGSEELEWEQTVNWRVGIERILEG